LRHDRPLSSSHSDNGFFALADSPARVPLSPVLSVPVGRR